MENHLQIYRDKANVVRDLMTGQPTAYLNLHGEVACGVCHQEACGVHSDCFELAGPDTRRPV